MPGTNRARTILISEDTPLAANLPIESEAFLPGWRVVKNLDRSTVARNIDGANWNFFYLAGEIRATVLGRDPPGTLPRAANCVLPAHAGQQMNTQKGNQQLYKPALPLFFLYLSAHK